MRKRKVPCEIERAGFPRASFPAEKSENSRWIIARANMKCGSVENLRFLIGNSSCDLCANMTDGFN